MRHISIHRSGTPGFPSTARRQARSRSSTAAAPVCTKGSTAAQAYFAAGGLGILAGDHLKSASDLGLPLVGVGLLYQGGYFRQYLSADGWQQEKYPTNDFYSLPIAPMMAICVRIRTP